MEKRNVMCYKNGYKFFPSLCNTTAIASIKWLHPWIQAWTAVNGIRTETWKTHVHWGLPRRAALGTVSLLCECEWGDLRKTTWRSEVPQPTGRQLPDVSEAIPDQLSNPRIPLSFEVIYSAAKAHWHRDKRLRNQLNGYCSSPDESSRGLVLEWWQN